MPTTSDFERMLRGRTLRVTRPRVAVRYEARIGDNHHHVVCRSCRVVADADCAVSTTPCLTASDDHGFTIEEAEIIYWGRCPECVAATSAASGG